MLKAKVRVRSIENKSSGDSSAAASAKNEGSFL